MTAIDGLTELSDRAVQADTDVRALAWKDVDDLAAARRKVTKLLIEERLVAARPSLGAVVPSPEWQERLAGVVTSDRDAVAADPIDPAAVAAQREADAEAAVAVARLSLLEAYRAVISAQEAVMAAGTTDLAVARGVRPLATGNPVVQHGREISADTKDEFGYVLRDRPRSILIKLALSLGIGVGYLVLMRIFSWDSYSELVPFLALFALSGVIGGVVCTNALSWDATRVRRSLTGGDRLWHVLVGKNITMFVLVGAVGVVLSILLAWWAGGFDVLPLALGELVTMMLVWLGVGNVLSVLNPLRVEPLGMRFKDGTLWPFLLSFVVSYVVGLGVNLILAWKIWAKKSMAVELGGTWVPLLMLIVSALVLYLLLTALAVQLSDRTRVRRVLVREMVDYKQAAAA